MQNSIISNSSFSRSLTNLLYSRGYNGRFKNRMKVLAVLMTLGFFGYQLLIDQHYRLNSDEYACMSFALDGIPGIGYAMKFYLEREGNFLSMILQGIGMRVLGYGFPPIIYFFLIKLGLWLAIYWFVTTVFLKVNRPLSFATRVLCSSVVITTLYLISPNKPEIWHWAMGSIVYLLPIALVLVSAILLIRNQILFALVPLAFLMQSRITYGILFFGATALLFIAMYLKNREGRAKYLAATAFLLGLLIMYLLAPGNSDRLPQESFSSQFLIHQFFYGITSLFVSFNLAKLDRLLIGLMAIVPLLPKIKYELTIKCLTLPGLLYIAFVVALAGLFLAATGYAPWTRVLSMHSFLFVVIAIFYSHYLYSRLTTSQNVDLTVASFGVLLLLISVFWCFPTRLKQAQEFSHAYDLQREEVFSYNENSSDTLFLDQLPDPGVLGYFPFDEDPTYWINSDFRKAYNLKFYVAQKRKRLEDSTDE